MPTPRLKVCEQLVAIDAAHLREIAENRQHGPGAQIHHGLHIPRERARQVPGDAAAGDVRHGGDPAASQNVFQQRPVGAVRLQQFGADLVATSATYVSGSSFATSNTSLRASE